MHGDKMERLVLAEGKVEEKIREKFVDALDRAMKTMGAEEYASGMEQAKKLIAFAQNGIDAIKTLDDLRAALDALPPMSEQEEMVYLLLAQNLPALLRFGFKEAAKAAAKDLPALNPGRPPALRIQKAREALDYVSKLHRDGCRLEVAKYRASKRFDCSTRTIARLWKVRGTLFDVKENHSLSIKEALRYISEAE